MRKSRGKRTETTSLMTNQIDKGHIDYKSELLRKSIHLCSLSIPVFYYFITKELALAILIPLLLFSLLLELGRFYVPSIKNIFNSLFGFLLRKHELDEKKKNLSGASYVFISAVLTILLFPKAIVITAFSALIICDIAAALIGRKFGKHKFLAKSLEGTLAFFVSGILVVIVTPKIEYSITEYIIGIAAIAVGSIAENISYGWADDNLTIPVSIGLTMWILYTLFLPGVSLVL